MFSYPSISVVQWVHNYFTNNSVTVKYLLWTDWLDFFTILIETDIISALSQDVYTRTTHAINILFSAGLFLNFKLNEFIGHFLLRFFFNICSMNRWRCPYLRKLRNWSTTTMFALSVKILPLILQGRKALNEFMSKSLISIAISCNSLQKYSCPILFSSNSLVN